MWLWPPWAYATLFFFPMASVGQPMETLGPCPFFFESIYNSKCKMKVKSKVKFKQSKTKLILQHK